MEMPPQRRHETPYSTWKRTWTIIATCAEQGRWACGCIHDAVQAHVTNQPAPAWTCKRLSTALFQASASFGLSSTSGTAGLCSPISS